MSEEVKEAPWTELSGRLSEAGHALAVRVYFEDTDFSGVVYHTSYLRWCERGRTDFLRLLGIKHSELAGAHSLANRAPLRLGASLRSS